MEVKKSLLAGNNIATALKKLNLYNERFSILITAGEESGYLSENLLQISKILKQDFEYKLKKINVFIRTYGSSILRTYCSFCCCGYIFANTINRRCV